MLQIFQQFNVNTFSWWVYLFFLHKQQYLYKSMPTKDFDRELCVILAITVTRFTKSQNVYYTDAMILMEKQMKKKSSFFWKRKTSLWNVQTKLITFTGKVYTY